MIEKKRSGRRMLVVLMLLFVAPPVIAFWLYYGTGWRPAATTIRGELIEPVRALAQSAATQRADGTQVFRSKWSLVVISTDGCGAACRSGLNYVQRTLASLGRLQSRTQLVLLSDTTCCKWDLAELGFKDLLRVDATQAPQLLQTFPETQRAQMIFVIDPLGNLLMRYDSGRDPKGLREDLQHLLELSQIG